MQTSTDYVVFCKCNLWPILNQIEVINGISFFFELQSQGRYAFTFEELRNRFKSSEKTLLQGLYRYKTKKQIAQIRKGFYVIIPPNYSNQGMLPPYLFIDVSHRSTPSAKHLHYRDAIVFRSSQ